jgi:hypothetical protein
MLLVLQIQTEDPNNETETSLLKDYIGWIISALSGGAAAGGLIYTARTFDNNRKTTFVTTFYDIRKQITDIESKYPLNGTEEQKKIWRRDFLNYVDSLAWLIESSLLHKEVAAYFKNDLEWAFFYIKKNKTQGNYKDIFTLCNEMKLSPIDHSGEPKQENVPADQSDTTKDTTRKASNQVTKGSSFKLPFTMNEKLLIIDGAIMLAIGFIGAIPFGSIVIDEAAQQELDPTTQRPEPIFFGIISLLYAEMAFMTIGIVGFSLLVLGAAMRQESKRQRQLRVLGLERL